MAVLLLLKHITNPAIEHIDPVVPKQLPKYILVKLNTFLILCICSHILFNFCVNYFFCWLQIIKYIGDFHFSLQKKYLLFVKMFFSILVQKNGDI